MKFELFSVVVAAISAAALCSACSNSEFRETPEEKSEWSVLQSVEFTRRTTKIAEPILVVVNGFDVLGVQGANGENVWVLLKPTAPPYYKQMPSQNYQVPRALVDKIIRERKVSYTVEQVLLSRMGEN